LYPKKNCENICLQTEFHAVGLNKRHFMENHPVPQNISSYEFRLVGDMTLKQFLQLAAGIAVGVFFIRLQLLAIIKYPLALISFMTGVLMAFIPINGRPFSSWLLAFIKAIYSPTEYVWLPDSAIAPPPSPVVPTPVPAVVPVTPPVTPPPISSVLPPVSLSPLPQPVKVTEVPFSFKKPVPVVTPLVTQTTTATVPPIVRPPAPVLQVPVPPQKPSPIAKENLSAGPPVAPAKFTAPIPAPKTSAINSAPTAPTTNMISSPTNPNILAGLILDASGQPLSATTVEIVDTKTGIPARALRTNKLGQFQIAIPLQPGSYNVLVEKEGFTFDQVSVQIRGSIVPPVIIQGKTA
jgi:hypothetical protein